MFEYTEKPVATVVLRFAIKQNRKGSKRTLFGRRRKGWNLELLARAAWNSRLLLPSEFAGAVEKKKHSKCFVSGKIAPYTNHVILVSRQPFDGFVRLSVVC